MSKSQKNHKMRVFARVVLIKHSFLCFKVYVHYQTKYR